MDNSYVREFRTRCWFNNHIVIIVGTALTCIIRLMRIAALLKAAAK